MRPSLPVPNFKTFLVLERIGFVLVGTVKTFRDEPSSIGLVLVIGSGQEARYTLQRDAQAYTGHRTPVSFISLKERYKVGMAEETRGTTLQQEEEHKRVKREFTIDEK